MIRFLKNHLFLLCTLCVIFYTLPVVFELVLRRGWVFGNAVWYAYVFPAILLGYSFGLKGGIFNALFGTVLALAVEYFETHLYAGGLRGAVDTLLMVGLTAFMSVGIGYMADIFKKGL
ncbi:hypothetical protein G7K71_12280 [Desulfofundulus sp. TPOSR]|uniref:VanZ family protein n=1 Tax=Desulfofundulus kuznetsovii (strain DSM 6115 / VKM B-1805 / 17) TaxID=760568 RepID=A0AAU8PU90_DESK7|nr:hypothetical protein [Desulfofundulus sp. TPOSR]AEG15596.1 hypothetical protein Desku_2040 [Desulfofundulus kuznetsovii DSM 6115]NHM27741.1 hypothetical protein [Desulfofundulus sp. TPOSR]